MYKYFYLVFVNITFNTQFLVLLMLLFVRRWRRWPLSHLRGGGGWPGWWVRMWLVRPILARNSLGQWGQGMVAAAGSLAVSFLACLRCSSYCRRPVGFTALGALVDCGSPPTPVLCCNFPWVRVDTECLEGSL